MRTIKVAVVTRQLGDFQLVPMALIPEPKDSVDDLEHYFSSETECVKKEFCQKFPEFKEAHFTYAILTLDI